MTKREQPQSVAEASAALEALQETRARAIERNAELDEQRQQHAYGAHVQHDPESRKALDAVNHEASMHASELASIADNRDYTEKMREAFISIQKTIEAIDRAIQDEKVLAAPISHTEGELEEAEVEEGGPILPPLVEEGGPLK